MEINPLSADWKVACGWKLFGFSGFSGLFGLFGLSGY
jgi:hypothetical protein